MCEEFGGYPPDAARAWDEDDGLILEVMDVRAFVRAWQARALYESQDPRPPREPDMPKALRDRLIAARYARLRAEKQQRDG